MVRWPRGPSVARLGRLGAWPSGRGADLLDGRFETLFVEEAHQIDQGVGSMDTRVSPEPGDPPRDLQQTGHLPRHEHAPVRVCLTLRGVPCALCHEVLDLLVELDLEAKGVAVDDPEGAGVQTTVLVSEIVQ